eukprot:9961924-Heterocapsa_arctica.AAC.1
MLQPITRKEFKLGIQLIQRMIAELSKEVYNEAKYTRDCVRDMEPDHKGAARSPRDPRDIASEEAEARDELP